MARKIIAVSGPPGAGKSTLSRRLATHLRAAFVQYDDYETITAWAPDRVIAWLDSGAPMDEVSAPGLCGNLMTHDGTVIFETPFGRSCRETGKLIDFSIWLECPADIALARKLMTLTSRAHENKGFAPYLHGWLDAYLRFTHRALVLQRERVLPLADVEIAVEQPVEAVFQAAVSKML